MHCHPPEELVVLLDFQALRGVLAVLSEQGSEKVDVRTSANHVLCLTIA